MYEMASEGGACCRALYAATTSTRQLRGLQLQELAEIATCHRHMR